MKSDADASENETGCTRRGLFLGAAATLICTPAIVRASSLMPVQAIPFPVERQYYGFIQRLYVDCYLPRILKLRRAGLSARAVAATLNSCNLKSANDKEWDAESVVRVLTLDQNIRREDGIRTREQRKTKNSLP
jgi:hypothetical protein